MIRSESNRQSKLQGLMHKQNSAMHPRKAQYASLAECIWLFHFAHTLVATRQISQKDQIVAFVARVPNKIVPNRRDKKSYQASLHCKPYVAPFFELQILAAMDRWNIMLFVSGCMTLIISTERP